MKTETETGTVPRINKKLIGQKPYILPKVDGPCLYKLDIIEFLQQHHPAIGKAIVESLEDIHLYPHSKLEDGLIDMLKKYNGVSNVGSDILLTHGSDSALKTIIETFTNPGDIIGYASPNYPHFVSFVKCSPCSLRDYPIAEPEELLTIDLSDVSLFYISSPNLPLGYRVPQNVVCDLTSRWPQTMFIVDEAYHEYSENTDESASSLHLNNLFVTRTFSKAFGLAGMRLGYTISTRENIETLRIIHNEKSVTTQSIAAGHAAMSQLDYYLGLAEEIQKSKEYLRAILQKICCTESEIYDFSIRDGNFFLIFARDTKAVCKQFADCGIFIRDKSSEIPDAIRIGMGPHGVQLDVVRMIAAVNHKTLIGHANVIFDLDNTLRVGSNHWAKVPADILMGVRPNDLIVTNNGRYTSEELSTQTSIPLGQIHGPIDRITHFAHDTHSSVLIIGPTCHIPVRHLVTQWLPGMTVKSKDYEYLFVTYIPCLAAIHVIKQLYDANIPVYYTDSNEQTTIEDYLDAPTEMSAMFSTYDLAGFMKRLFPESKCCDKTDIKSAHAIFSLVVGDSDRTDGVLASNLELPFVKINNAIHGVILSPKKIEMSIDTFMAIRSTDDK